MRAGWLSPLKRGYLHVYLHLSALAHTRSESCAGRDQSAVISPTLSTTIASSAGGTLLDIGTVAAEATVARTKPL